MYKTKIEKCNYDLLEQQKQALIDDIVFGETTDFFNIHALEAGVGKTRTAEYALAKMVNETNHNAILVRYSNNDCKESVAKINSLVGETIAISYFNEGSTREERIAKQKDFPQYRILVIPHQRYLQLTKSSSQRNIFTKGRNTLIIDEFINDVKGLILTSEKIMTLKSILKSEPHLYIRYSNIVSEIEDKILSKPSFNIYLQLRLKSKVPINNEINNLNKLIKANIDDIRLKKIIASISDEGNIDKNFLNEISTVSTLCSVIEEIKEFYNQAILMNNEVLYVPDSRLEYLLLEKNIILDASAELQPAYRMNPNKFCIKNVEKVLDHSEWELINIIANSTLSGKEKIENYYDIVNQYLVQNHYSENTLVVGNQSELPLITSVCDENKIYFGNLIGSNKWAELKNVAIVQTPNIKDIEYLLRYLHYSRDHLNSTTYKWTTYKSGKGNLSTHAFTDERIEEIRILFIANEIYQAVKRVNRRMAGKTKVILICNMAIRLSQQIAKELTGLPQEAIYRILWLPLLCG